MLLSKHISFYAAADCDSEEVKTPKHEEKVNDKTVVEGDDKESPESDNEACKKEEEVTEEEKEAENEETGDESKQHVTFVGKQSLSEVSCCDNKMLALV